MPALPNSKRVVSHTGLFTTTTRAKLFGEDDTVDPRQNLFSQATLQVAEGKVSLGELSESRAISDPKPTEPKREVKVRSSITTIGLDLKTVLDEVVRQRNLLPKEGDAASHPGPRSTKQIVAQERDEAIEIIKGKPGVDSEQVEDYLSQLVGGKNKKSLHEVLLDRLIRRRQQFNLNVSLYFIFQLKSEITHTHIFQLSKKILDLMTSIKATPSTVTDQDTFLASNAITRLQVATCFGIGKAEVTNEQVGVVLFRVLSFLDNPSLHTALPENSNSRELIMVRDFLFFSVDCYFVFRLFYSLIGKTKTVRCSVCGLC